MILVDPSLILQDFEDLLQRMLDETGVKGAGASPHIITSCYSALQTEQNRINT
jgi:hypothetical protein